jgi:predicted dehydrogenase
LGKVPSLRWGILGTGWIADKFVRSVSAHTDQIIAAVGSRTTKKAQEFARDHNIATAHGSYDALVYDPTIEVVYVATPHTDHHRQAMLALGAGKHVLVEKPMALDHAQALEMATLARQQGLFLAEALWTYFLPKFDVIDQLLADNVLGDIRSVYTEYGEYFTSEHRIFDRGLAGGPLLDLGTYPVSLLTRLLGVPSTVAGVGEWHPSGVMGQLAVVMANARGAIGTMATTMHGFTPANAIITGTKASIWFDTEFHLPGGFVLRVPEGDHFLHYAEDRGAHHQGLFHEALEVARCIGVGLTETPKRALGKTLTTLETLDRIRDSVGLRWDVR